MIISDLYAAFVRPETCAVILVTCSQITGAFSLGEMHDPEIASPVGQGNQQQQQTPLGDGDIGGAGRGVTCSDRQCQFAAGVRCRRIRGKAGSRRNTSLFSPALDAWSLLGCACVACTVRLCVFVCACCAAVPLILGFSVMLRINREGAGGWQSWCAWLLSPIMSCRLPEHQCGGLATQLQLASCT